ncbi:MAG TPA: response regulator transcription factor [Planctomycetaceae bacterium]|nr:response regulator transcription factor [Planctomycetaceae bacterium]
MLVVDDHALFRRGLVEVLAQESNVDVVGEAADGREASEKVRALTPDVVCMDLNMKGQDGITATAYLTQEAPSTRVLILTVSEEPADLFNALRVGARGYVVKTSTTTEIVDAIRQVHQGWVVLSPAMAPRMMSDLARPPQAAAPPAAARERGPDDDLAWQLTNREHDVLRLVARGMSNAEIAESLFVSENTVKTHIKNILGKLQVKNRRQALVYAARAGILRSDPQV